MIFIILILYALLIVPTGCFLVAATAEIRSHKKGPVLLFLLRMVEIATGIIGIWATTLVDQSVARSWTMVCASLLLGGVSMLSNYTSRVALRCVLIGSAFLAFLWYFKGAYHP